MKNRILDVICLGLTGAVFGSVALFNVLQPDRPTESVTEQRKLAEMPAFSWSALADGSYFSDVSAFVSDTFICRDKLVSVSKEMDTLRGFDYRIDGEDGFVLLDANQQPKPEGDDGLNDALANAFDQLGKPDVPAETEAEKPVLPEASGNETEPPVPETAVPDVAETEAKPPVNPEDTQSVPETGPAEEGTVVTAIHLSRNTMKLTVGSGAVVYATVDTNTDEGASVSWSISNKNIASISINPQGGINVKGVAPGTCTLTCSYEDTLRETCEVTVSEVVHTAKEQTNLEADFLTGGMFIYGDAVYTQAFYVESTAKAYAQTALYYKQLFGEDVRVSTVVAPVSSICVENSSVQAKIPDQQAILNNMASWMDPSVNFVDVYAEMYDHRDEYLYFKSDHHWTQRGAYYAYRAFANSVGFEPTELDEFDYEIRNDSYNGSLYQYTFDERVKGFVDTIEAFKTRKPHSMTITSTNGSTYSYDTAIVPTNKTYVTFIAGDNPYTVINVPENPQDRNILVLKDSFGNAFVPFLCEHYGNIIVVDVRHTSMNVYEQLKDYGLTDIVFVNNIQAANTASWPRMYLSAVGVNG